MLIQKVQQLSKPTIGYNVIEQVMKQSEVSGQGDESKRLLNNTVRYAFPSLRSRKVQKFINLVMSSHEYLVKMAKDHVNVLKHTIVQVKSQVKAPHMK